MRFGSMPNDGGGFLLSPSELASFSLTRAQREKFIRRFYGSDEFIKGILRYCLWIEDENLEEAMAIAPIRLRIERVRQHRLGRRGKMARYVHRFFRISGHCHKPTMIVPRVSSENRAYLPVGFVNKNSIISDRAFALFDAPLWNMAIITSRLHFVWIDTVCGKLKTDPRYSNTLGWNSFPVPSLTRKNRDDLTRCAEDILLAREVHFPASLADLYVREKMPENLRHAHERNDEVLERIYIGRRFKNDSERLEKLFDLYTKMIGETEKSMTKRRKTK